MKHNYIRIEISSTMPEHLGVESIKEPWRSMLLREVIRASNEYYKDPDHVKEFEEWYLKKYGKPYVEKNNDIYGGQNEQETARTHLSSQEA